MESVRIFLPLSVCAFTQEWNDPHQILNFSHCWETGGEEGAGELFTYYVLPCCLKFL